MAVVLTLSWPGASKEQYDELRDLVDWEAQPAAGGIFHVVWWEGDTMKIVDVWESEQAWQSFFDERLSPRFAEVGIDTQPDAQAFHPAHRYFNIEAA